MKPQDDERKIIEDNYVLAQEKRKIPVDPIKEILKLTGDASTRRYFRIFSDQNSYVVCLDKPTDMSLNEFPFYQMQNLLEKEAIRVPQIHFTDLKEGFLLEEDLGDVTLIKKLISITDKNEELDLYKKCVDLILKVHKVQTPNDEKLQCNRLSFDFSKLMSEMEFTLDYFFNRLLKYKLSDKENTILKTHLGNICIELAKYPMVLTHRDYHSRNIMLKNEELVLIDFQDARKGIPQYDLVSLLEDCYYSLHPENLAFLKNYYYEKLPISNLGQTRNEYERLYDLMLVQRVFKAVGSFAYIYNWRRDGRYIKYIGYAMEKVRSTLMKYPEFNELRTCINKIYYEH